MPAVQDLEASLQLRDQLERSANESQAHSRRLMRERDDALEECRTLRKVDVHDPMAMC